MRVHVLVFAIISVLYQLKDYSLCLDFQAEKFHEDHQSFVNWLTSTEKKLDRLQPAGCTLDTMQLQIQSHKELSEDITANREKMLALDKTSTHLRYFSQKSDATLIKNTSISVQHR